MSRARRGTGKQAGSASLVYEAARLQCGHGTPCPPFTSRRMGGGIKAERSDILIVQDGDEGFSVATVIKVTV